MAAMETLVNTVTGASLCGQQQETLKHVLFPEISVKEKRRGAGGDPTRDIFRLSETTLGKGRCFDNTISCFHSEAQPAVQATSSRFKNNEAPHELWKSKNIQALKC